MRYILLPLAFLFSLSALAQQVALTFRVDMRQQTVSAKGVHVAGSFQQAAGFGSNWNPGGTPLSDADGDGIWETTVQVPAGRL
ncbi:hypothetical protein, partial [Cesiribacter andamanensis]|uniref:hypothetical protein n=1 Tax=Cesiribacter andamanensis TaxID=649507 RepID=UPI00059123D9